VRAALLLAFAILVIPAASATQPQQLAHDSVRVVYWPGDEGLAERALRVALAPHRFPGLPPGPHLVQGTIVLAPDKAVWDSVTGGRAPHWSAGVAIPAQRLIVLPARVAGGRADRMVALRHELAHLALHDYLPSQVPRWFSEGYATWAAGELDAGAAWQLRVAFLIGRAPPLDSLTLGWPAGAERARLAYLLSASAVQYMAERGGPQGFAALLAAWQRTGSLDTAIRSIYGMTLGHLEDEWVRTVRQRYGWLLMLSQVGVFWALAGLLLFLMFAHRVREKRRRIREMEAEYHMLPASTADADYPLESYDDAEAVGRGGVDSADRPG
jgi:hypothetical protein